MGKEAPSGVKVDRRIETEPIVVGGRRIQGVARLVGLEFGDEKPSGSYMGRMGRLTPLEVRIDNGDAQEILSFEDPMQEPIRGILTFSIAVSAACVLIMLATKIVARLR